MNERLSNATSASATSANATSANATSANATLAHATLIRVGTAPPSSPELIRGSAKTPAHTKESKSSPDKTGTENSASTSGHQDGNTTASGVTFPRYDRAALRPRIVHLGLGAFFRAHGAIYTEDVLHARGGDWGIIGVSLQRPDQRDRLAPGRH